MFEGLRAGTVKPLSLPIEAGDYVGAVFQETAVETQYAGGICLRRVGSWVSKRKIVFSSCLSRFISDCLLQSRKWVVQPSLIGLAPLVLVFWPKGVHPLGLTLVFFALGFFTAPGQIMYSHIKELVPPQVMSTAMTGINLFTMLGPAFIMQAMGLVVAAGPQGLSSPEGFVPAWVLCAAGLSLSGFLYLLVPDSRTSKERSAA